MVFAANFAGKLAKPRNRPHVLLRTTSMEPPAPITQILQNAAAGDAGAASSLVNLLYDELRGIAGNLLGGRPRGATLQPTMLVHEAWLRLADQENLQIESRDHFLRVAARAMRFVIIDHLRAKGRDKRGGDAARVPLDDLADYYKSSAVDMLALDDALNRLQNSDEQLARIVELRFFCGFTIPETAKILKISTPTVERGWRFARAWLHQQLES